MHGESIPDRKRRAGRQFVSACERVLQVEGPSALSRRTGRSQAWWSKLSNGSGARFPEWGEVVEVVVPGLDSVAVSSLRSIYRTALMTWHNLEDDASD